MENQSSANMDQAMGWIDIPVLPSRVSWLHNIKFENHLVWNEIHMWSAFICHREQSTNMTE